jgi:mono/diheme cytochrome c family protein
MIRLFKYCQVEIEVMHWALLWIAAVFAILWFPAATQATSTLRGTELYENHCTACHTSLVHIREKKKGKSLEQVEVWIRRWAGELKLEWRDEEVKDVLQYLNSRYYRY